MSKVILCFFVIFCLDGAETELLEGIKSLNDSILPRRKMKCLADRDPKPFPVRVSGVRGRAFLKDLFQRAQGDIDFAKSFESFIFSKKCSEKGHFWCENKDFFMSLDGFQKTYDTLLTLGVKLNCNKDIYQSFGLMLRCIAENNTLQLQAMFPKWFADSLGQQHVMLVSAFDALCDAQQEMSYYLINDLNETQSTKDIHCFFVPLLSQANDPWSFVGFMSCNSTILREDGSFWRADLIEVSKTLEAKKILLEFSERGVNSIPEAVSLALESGEGFDTKCVKESVFFVKSLPEKFLNFGVDLVDFVATKSRVSPDKCLRASSESLGERVFAFQNLAMALPFFNQNKETLMRGLLDGKDAVPPYSFLSFVFWYIDAKVSDGEKAKHRSALRHLLCNGEATEGFAYMEPLAQMFVSSNLHEKAMAVLETAGDSHWKAIEVFQEKEGLLGGASFLNSSENLAFSSGVIFYNVSIESLSFSWNL